MTSTQALKEARRRWGKRAMVEKRKQSHIAKSGGVLTGTHLVGLEMCGFFEVRGDGSSFEHAFAMSNWIK